jgi:hypothetical protein
VSMIDAKRSPDWVKQERSGLYSPGSEREIRILESNTEKNTCKLSVTSQYALYRKAVGDI